MVEFDPKRWSRLAASGPFLERLLHDLKQPLNHIRAVAQDLRIDARKDRLDLDAFPQDMKEIETAVDRLALLLDRLRVFARARITEAVPRAVDVGELCRAAVARARRSWEGVEVTESLEPDLTIDRGDPLVFAQALEELLDNGMQAARDGGGDRPLVHVSASRSGSDVVVAVADNGRGVPEDERARVFEPFFTTRGGAAGLGLALTIALARELGGRVELGRSDADGARFELHLPATGERAPD